jgi:hypothetical protein
MGEPTFRRRTGSSASAYWVLSGDRTVGSVTCTDDRAWVARLGPEERHCLDSQGEEITFSSRTLAAAVVVAAADVEASHG